MAEKTEPPDSVKNIKKKSFGPVSDLEEHVEPDWWKRIFNSI